MHCVKGIFIFTFNKRSKSLLVFWALFGLFGYFADLDEKCSKHKQNMYVLLK